jgi:asparagine synthase (glutamine-hydrolysing)
MWNTPESLYEKQPFENPSTKNIITADARIDNREDLFRQLKITDHTITDSQLILKAYEKWDNDCVKYLYGDFTFAIWNPNKEELFCARDHMGIRPLFYYFENGEFIFSTAIQGLTSFKYVSTELKDNYEYDLLCFVDYDYNKSIYKSIHLLPPSNYMTISKEGRKIQEYWDFDARKSITYKNENDYVENFKELLNNAIKPRLRTAFPLGAHLSAGLDSSAIIAYGLPFIKEKKQEFHTYGLTLAKKHHNLEKGLRDEREAMKLVKNHLGVENLHFIDLEGRNYLEDTKRLNKLGGGPYMFPTTLITLSTADYVSSNQGVRTLLSGELGNYGVSWKKNNYDELFLKFKWSQLLQGLYSDKGNFLMNIARFMKNSYSKATAPSISQDKLNIINPNYRKNAEYYIKSIIHEKGFFAESTQEQQIKFLKAVRARQFQDSLVAISKKVEFRYPLADIKLLEYFIALPDSQKYSKGINRLLFRKIVSDKLPHHIAWEFKSRVYSVPQRGVQLKQSADAVEQLVNDAYHNKQLDKLNYDQFMIALNEIRSEDSSLRYHNEIYKIIKYVLLKINCQK